MPKLQPSPIELRRQLFPTREIVQDDHQRRLGLNFVFAERALITVHKDSSRLSKLPSGWALEGDIKESWKVTDRSLGQVVKFLREELGWTTRRWLPSANALIPLVYSLSRRHNGFADKEQADVRRYLFLTGIRGLFREQLKRLSIPISNR